MKSLYGLRHAYAEQRYHELTGWHGDGMAKVSHAPSPSAIEPVNLNANASATHTTGFHQAPNPTLQLYVYPHLAGELPVPGYVTEFKAYEKDSWMV